MDLSEVEAMAKVGEALEGLDNDTRKRVIKWIVDKFKIDGIKFEESAGYKSDDARLNTFEYEETQEKRSVRASFTDEVGNNVSQILGSYVSRPKHDDTEIDQNLLLGGETVEISSDEIEDESSSGGVPRGTDEVEAGDTRGRTNEETDLGKLKKVFRYEDDKIALDNPRLKATSRRDFVRRLTYLFLYAHRLEGRVKVPREHLNRVLKECSVYDGNARGFITQDDGLIREEENRILGLNLVGRERAKEVLQEVLDSEVENEWSITSAYK